ncbi:MAG TPA: SURF1 family protein [Sphingomicrobium sp.]|jgi:cytochrome oxidase assembly protein ShyY1|nr:SURF1 family protein [Sphingomicrobium sp.]
MTKRLPVAASIIVAAAVALMIGLGVWQLQRAKWKEGLLAQYSKAQNQPPITWPTVPISKDHLPLFRHATGVCLRPVANRATAGENKAGEPGYVQIVECATGAEGPGMSVEVGWSKNPNAKINWAGGPVSGVIAPDQHSGMRLVAASAPPGLEPSATPSLESIPNNHRSYAFQWFSFAAIALIIYGLALKRRWKEERAQK